jgi:alkylation response protein AidB-like acyl-CoA dehydrogenase
MASDLHRSGLLALVKSVRSLRRRDYTIFEGTGEIQRLVIARALSDVPIR